MNYQRLLRRIRQRIFDYDDLGQAEKAQRVLLKVKAKALGGFAEPLDRHGCSRSDYRALLRHGIVQTDL